MEATLVPPPEQPLNYDVPRPDSQSRITNFPIIGGIIRLILAIPHFIVLWFLGLVAGVMIFIAPFAILFTGRFPRGMFDFVAGYQRWNASVTAYIFHLRDEYPAFTMDAGKYALTYEVAYPDTLSRILNFPIFGAYIKLLLLIPHLIILAFLFLAVFLTTFIGEFGILFTGAYPADLQRFAVGVLRWSQRTTLYSSFMTDKYPPFSLS